MSRTRFAALATFVVLALVGCANNEPRAVPSHSPSPTLTGAPSSPSPSEPAVVSRLTDRERRAYMDAVDDYKHFAVGQAKILARGKATKSAQAFYRQRTAAWRSYWGMLQQREAIGLRIKGMGRTIRTRPGPIRLDSTGGGTIELRVCGVAEGVRVFQNGQSVQQPHPVPRIVRASMVSVGDESPWRLLSEHVGPKC